jgi:hypothetical protein
MKKSKVNLAVLIKENKEELLKDQKALSEIDNKVDNKIISSRQN